MTNGAQMVNDAKENMYISVTATKDTECERSTRHGEVLKRTFRASLKHVSIQSSVSENGNSNHYANSFIRFTFWQNTERQHPLSTPNRTLGNICPLKSLKFAF